MADLTTEQQVSAAIKRAEEAEAKVKALETEIETSNALVAELSGKLSASVSSGGKVFPTVTLGKDKYTFTAEPGNVPPFGVLKADEIGDNSEALKHLVKIGASCLEKVK